MNKFREIYVLTVLTGHRKQTAARHLYGYALLRGRFENNTTTSEFGERFGFTQGLMANVIADACRQIACEISVDTMREVSHRYVALVAHPNFETTLDELVSRCRKVIDNDALCDEIEQCLNPGSNTRFLFRRFKKAPPRLGRPRVNAKAGC